MIWIKGFLNILFKNTQILPSMHHHMHQHINDCLQFMQTNANNKQIFDTLFFFLQQLFTLKSIHAINYLIISRKVTHYLHSSHLNTITNWFMSLSRAKKIILHRAMLFSAMFKTNWISVHFHSYTRSSTQRQKHSLYASEKMRKNCMNDECVQNHCRWK